MRFFAALWVAFYHFNQPIPYLDNPYRNALKLGYVGVPMFFVISGYCIIYSAERAASCGDYLVRRFFRIYPPYLVSLGVTFVAIVISKLLTGYNSVAILPKNVYGIIGTFSLMLSPVTRVLGINWVYWTLTLEVIFYLIVAVSRLLPENLRLSFFIVVSGIGWLLPAGEDGLLAVFKYWPIFSLGICIYYIQQRQQILLLVLLLVVNLTWLVSQFLLAGKPPYFYASVLAMLAILISFKYPIKPNWLSIAGDYSYSVYLLHVPIAVYLMGLIKTSYVQQHVLLNIGFDILCYLITLALAYCMFKWVELPSIAWGKRISKNKAARGPVAKMT